MGCGGGTGAHDSPLLLALAARAGKCEVDARERVNCGYPGVTAEECKKRDCCFVDHPPGYPWCFHPENRNKTTGREKEDDSGGTAGAARWAGVESW